MKEEVGTSSTNKDTQDAKIQEMSIVIKGISNKLTRLKVEGHNSNRAPLGGIQRNPNQYQIPFNPRIMNRERINKNQPIQSSVRENNNNNFADL